MKYVAPQGGRRLHLSIRTNEIEKLRRHSDEAGIVHYRYEDLFWIHRGGDRSAIDVARKAVQLLEEHGHEVLTRHLVDENAWEADRLISAQEVYRRDMAWLEQCQLFIAEVSGSSFGLGFETGYLLGGTNKKVILLYRREVEHKVSLLISGNTHPNCTLVPYGTAGEVETFITDNIRAG